MSWIYRIIAEDPTVPTHLGGNNHLSSSIEDQLARVEYSLLGYRDIISYTVELVLCHSEVEELEIRANRCGPIEMELVSYLINAKSDSYPSLCER